MFEFKKIAFLITFLFIAYSLNGIPLEATGGAPPPNPTIYTGSITVGGQVPSDSTVVLEGVRRRCIERCVTAKLGTFTSDAGIVENGIYVVTFGPPDATMVNSQITFHYEGLVKADLEDTFILRPTIRTESNWNLNFPAMPAVTPTPVTQVSEESAGTPATNENPLIVPLAPVIVDNNTEGSGIPVVSENNLYLSISGEIAYDSESYSDVSLALVAKVGSYFTDPVPIMEYTKEAGTSFAVFDSLIIEPSSSKFIGKSIDFYIRTSDGSSAEVKVVGQPLVFGETVSDIDIELEATDLKTDPSNPPSTSLLPEDKMDSAESTDSNISSDNSEAGTCSRVESVTLLQGSGDMAMMLAPILLLVGYAGWKRRK
ncbi:MAG: hypothetical protein CL782_05050 [Chloroflexi bacterium]|nr:hypothetical protein [Chloroflexota bacterium]